MSPTHSPLLSQRLAVSGLRLVWLALFAAVLFHLWQQLLEAPPRVRVAEITLTVPPAASVVLGRHELAAPLSETSHLRVSRDALGSWSLANVSQNRAVEVTHDGEAELLRSVKLTAGSRFLLAGQWWLVRAVTPALVLEDEHNHQAWWYSGVAAGRWSVEGAAEAQPPCADSTWAQRLRSFWNAVVPVTLGRPARLELGGYASCATHVPFPALEPGAVWVEKHQGDFRLRATAPASRRVCVAPGSDGQCAAGGFLHEQEATLAGVSRLIVGRAEFAVRTIDDHLILKPTGRMEWLPPVLASERAEALRAQGIEWRLQTEDALAWPGQGLVSNVYLAAAGLLGGGLLLVLANVVRWQAGVKPRTGGFLYALGVLAGMLWGAFGIIAFFLGGHWGAVWYLVLILGGGVLLCLTPWRGLLVWLVLAGAASLMLAGVAAQFGLGLQAPDSGGWRFFQKTAAAAGATLAAWSVLIFWGNLRALRAGRRIAAGNGRMNRSLIIQEVAIWGLALLALLALGAQALLGAEEGVAGFQPVEFAKFALLVTSAHVMALRLEYLGQPGWWRHLMLWLRAALPVSLFLVLVAMSLVLLNDYSPLVLLAAWLFGLLLAWSVAGKSPVAMVLAALAVVGGVWLFLTVQGEGLSWLLSHGFYPERFAVWLDPSHHPHNGEQFLRASALLNQGGWQGNPMAQGWSVPAAQTDFTPAWFIAHFGLRAVVVLVAIQALWLGSLFALGWQCLRQVEAGDYLAAWQGRLCFFALWGFATLFAGHFLLSWGTNLGWLPVMGQPMPMLAAGSSLVGLLVAPMLALLIPRLHTSERGAR